MTEADPQEIVRRVQEWCDLYSDRSYVLMVIARKKDNDAIESYSWEKVTHRVITDEESAEDRTLDALAQMSRYDDLNFRVYVSVNARDTLSAYIQFTQNLVQWSGDLLQGNEPVKEKILHPGSEWRRTLHKPEHRDDRLFLFDLDGVDESDVERFVEACPNDAKAKVETPNGYHVVTNPFDYTAWEPPVEYDELSTDGELFVGRVGYDE